MSYRSLARPPSRRDRRAIRLACGFLALLPGLAAGAPDAMTILARSAAAKTSVSLEGTRTVTLYDSGRRASAVQQRVHRAPGGKERTETISEGSYRGRLAVSDGKTLWEYYPREAVCIKRALPGAAELARHRETGLRRARAQLRARLIGVETLTGRPAFHVLVTNPAGQRVYEAWVDTATYVEIRGDSYPPGGVLGSSIRLTSLSLRPKLSPTLFSFHPPAGCRLQDAPGPTAKLTLTQAEKKAGFRAWLPAYLPSGHVLCGEQTALLRCPTQGLVVWTVYGNGLDSFSLFQSRCAQQPAPAAGRDLACWRAKDFLFTLVGEMSQGELAKVKVSIRQR